MSSFANVKTINMELTPVRVTFDGNDLGGSLGNVTITAKYGKAEIKADQSGNTVRDRRVNSLEISATTELVEIQNKDVVAIVFPHASVIVSGTKKAIQWNSKIGDSDLANAKVLNFHPLSKDDTDVDTDHTFFKACSNADSSIVYGPSEQCRFKLVWNILPDDSVTPERFYRYGDTTI